jgi:polyisoprenoid-binding protein YceI
MKLIPFSLAIALVPAVTCGAGAQPVVTAKAQSPSPSTSPTLAVPPGGLVVTVATGSKATVRVRELLAVDTIQTDAVLATDAVSGAAAMLGDGSFAPDSKIVVDVRSLRSDEALRDKWVQLFGLQWGTWPTADFVPTKARGLPLPLPATGDWTFSLDGHLRVRDMTRDVTWAVVAKRNGDALIATATTTVHWADFGVPKPQAAVTQVVSVTDDIRLELALTGSLRG